MRWRARSLPRKWDWASSAGGGSRSGRRGQRLARIVADALDHRTQAVGALRRQVVAETEFVEHLDRVGRQDLLRRVAGIERQQDRDQAAHDVGVAVAEIVQLRLAAVAAVELF